MKNSHYETYGKIRRSMQVKARPWIAFSTRRSFSSASRPLRLLPRTITELGNQFIEQAAFIATVVT